MIDLFEQEAQKLKLILKEPKVIPVGMNFTLKSIDMYKINMQYGCVRNSIVHRANSKKSLERLDKYYKELFNKK